jgi:DNA-directed RNA polymerase specialized sigma24 family protein
MSHDPFFPFSDEAHYLGLRRRLLRFFTTRNCHCAPDLADDTLLRVLQTHSRRRADCSLDQWTFAVARNVLREWRRGNLRTVQLDAAPQSLTAWRFIPERCRIDLDRLPLDSSDLAFLREYFFENTRARVIALESGLSAAGVRSRAHRLITRLRRCLPAASSVSAPVET